MTLPRLRPRRILDGLLLKGWAPMGLQRRTAAGLTLLAVAAGLVLTNLAAARFPWRLDTTLNRRFSLAPQTREILAALPGPVTAVGFFTPEEAAQQAYMEDLLREYQHTSGGRLTWSMVDPSANPSLAAQYGVTRTAVTVLSYQGKQEQVDEWDMLGDFDPFTGQPQLNGEQALTSALLRLTTAHTPRVYFLEGHGEAPLWEWPRLLQAEGYQQEPLSLATLPAVPADADALVMAGPTRDLTAAEVQMLEAYLAKGGRVAVFLAPGQRLPVLEGWLASWGVTVRDDLVVDPARHYLYDATAAVPVYQGHAVTRKLAEARTAMVMPGARSLAVAEAKEGFRYEPLLTTSAEAWGETRWGEGAPQRDAADHPGPLTLAVAVTRAAVEQAESRVLVAGSVSFAADDALALQGNLDFAMAGLGWLTDRPEGIAIRAHGPDTPPLFFTTREATAILTATTLVMPLLFLAIGGWIWYRRRHL